MAVAYMTSVNISNYNQKLDDVGWEYEDVITGGAANGSSVIMPDNISGGVSTLIVSAGTGKIQATSSSLAKVLAGTETWVDWASGVVAASTQDSFVVAPTAIRQVNASGTTTLQIRAQ